MNKKSLFVLSAGTAFAVTCGAFAEMEFFDAAGDEAHNNHNLDLTKVTVSNTDTTIRFVVQVMDLHSDWGKHVVFLDTGASGHAGNSNPWFRNVDHNGNSISHFIGSWLDGGGGGSISQYNPGSDSWNGASPISKSVDWSNDTFTYEIALSDLGVSLGDTLRFDIGSTGGSNGDPVVDMFSNGTHGTWGGSSSLGSDLLEYTIVPGPGALALFGIGGLFARRRRA